MVTKPPIDKSANGKAASHLVIWSFGHLVRDCVGRHSRANRTRPKANRFNGR